MIRILNLILFELSSCSLPKTCSFSVLLACAYVKYVIVGNQHMRLRKHGVTGGHRLVELQDHPLVLGLGPLTCHPGAADDGEAVCILQMVEPTFVGLCATIGNKFKNLWYMP